jgi:hypothetical protein
MRMYTLWKFDPLAHGAALLEYEGMPVLFAVRAEAEAYGQMEAEEWNDDVRVIPVTVGQA